MTIYIRPEDRDTRYPLWHVLYQCRVPYIQSMSVEELAQKGMHTTGIAAYDHAMAWEPRLMSIPVVRIIELWHSGANVHMVNADTYVRQIYEDIQKHLAAWTQHINQTYNIRSIPEEDLKIMDEFNNVMWEHAKWIDKKVTWDGMLGSRLNTPSIASFSSFWEKRDRIKNEEDAKKSNQVGGRFTSKRGLEFVADPASHLDELKRVNSIDHMGQEAPDIHPARTTWADLMNQYTR